MLAGQRGMVAVDGWHLTGGNPAAEITAHFKNCGTLDDELMPACTMQMHYALPNTHVTMFPNASHMPFFEEPGEYFATLIELLEANRAIASPAR